MSLARVGPKKNGSKMVSYLAPSWSCTHPAVAVLPLCFSAPLVHLILRLIGRPLHSRCTLHVASMRIYRNCTRTVHLGSAVALHCAARTAGACSFVIILTVSRPVAIRFSHGTHRGCRHIATDFPCVLCIVMHPPRIFSGSHSRTENSLHFTSSGAHLSLSAAAYGRYERGYHSQKQATPGFSLGDH